MFSLDRRPTPVAFDVHFKDGRVVNQAIEAMGLKNTQALATVFDGITRHSPEGLNFKQRAETVGWKQAVRERDSGTWDWTENRPINPR